MHNIPKANQNECGHHYVTHQGFTARCQGMTYAMKRIGVSVDELVIGEDPARARTFMQSYLSTNKDVHYIFTLGTLSCPWAYKDCRSDGIETEAL